MIVTMTAPSGGGEHGDRWSVRFRYHEQLVELLKTRSTGATGAGHPRTGAGTSTAGRCAAWPTKAAAGAAVRWLADSACRETESEPPPDWAQPSWAETLMDAVGLQRRDAVFRALSRVLHPDTETGDNDLMRELLHARELVK